MNNRKAATQEVLKWIEKILPGSENVAFYAERLKGLSDAQFDDYMKKLESGEETLSLIAPNFEGKTKLTVERNLEVAKELGHAFFERLWLTDPITRQTYLTPQKYLVVDLPLRRQQQLLIKKISIPEHNRSSDDLTGQASGDSHGAALSFPELQVLYALGMDRSIEELIKFRGGDLKAMRMLYQQLVDTGAGNQDSVKRIPTRVKSTETLETFLKSMHLDTKL